MNHTGQTAFFFTCVRYGGVGGEGELQDLVTPYKLQLQCLVRVELKINYWFNSCMLTIIVDFFFIVQTYDHHSNHRTTTTSKNIDRLILKYELNHLYIHF